MRLLLILFLIFTINLELRAQTDSTFYDFSAYVHLDSIMITAKRQGFSVEEFITIIQNDHSLETSFNNLRTLSYRYENDISFYNNNGDIKASYTSSNIQHYNGDCQWMEILEQEISGNYLNRKEEYNYYTSNLYDRVFYQPTLPCEKRKSTRSLSRSRQILEDRTTELKKLIYTPGQKADIPFIGNKTEIFSPKMMVNYDYTLKSGRHISGREAYVFTASIKPFFNMDFPNGSIVKFLEIQMDKTSNQVLSRKYKLQYDAGIYRFDILMMVDLEKYDGRYIPSDIKYDGYWKIVGKTKENCKFHFRITEFIKS